MRTYGDSKSSRKNESGFNSATAISGVFSHFPDITGVGGIDQSFSTSAKLMFGLNDSLFHVSVTILTIGLTILLLQIKNLWLRGQVIGPKEELFGCQSRVEHPCAATLFPAWPWAWPGTWPLRGTRRVFEEREILIVGDVGLRTELLESQCPHQLVSTNY